VKYVALHERHRCHAHRSWKWATTPKDRLSQSESGKAHAERAPQNGTPHETTFLPLNKRRHTGTIISHHDHKSSKWRRWQNQRWRHSRTRSTSSNNFRTICNYASSPSPLLRSDASENSENKKVIWRDLTVLPKNTWLAQFSQYIASAHSWQCSTRQTLPEMRYCDDDNDDDHTIIIIIITIHVFPIFILCSFHNW